MRFLVETSFNRPPTPEILALIPAEVEHSRALEPKPAHNLQLLDHDDARGDSAWPGRERQRDWSREVLHGRTDADDREEAERWR